MLTGVILGRNIAEARRQANLSQLELSELTGLDRSAISRIESGKKKVDSIELVKIAQALGVSELSLLTTEESLVYLRAPDAAPEEVKLQVKWINEFLENYELLKELA